MDSGQDYRSTLRSCEAIPARCQIITIRNLLYIRCTVGPTKGITIQAEKEDFTVEQVKTVLDRYQYDIELYIHIYMHMNIIFVCLFSIG